MTLPVQGKGNRNRMKGNKKIQKYCILHAGEETMNSYLFYHPFSDHALLYRPDVILNVVTLHKTLNSYVIYLPLFFFSYLLLNLLLI